MLHAVGYFHHRVTPHALWDWTLVLCATSALFMHVCVLLLSVLLVKREGGGQCREAAWVISEVWGSQYLYQPVRQSGTLLQRNQGEEREDEKK